MQPTWRRAVIDLVALGALAVVVAGAGRAAAGEPDIQFVEPEEARSADDGSSPFSAPSRKGPRRADAVPGYAELSSGLKVPGYMYTTRAKRLKIYNLQRQIYEYVAVAAVKEIEGVVEWARVDKQWRFKEAGNTEKVYTGKSYPVRMLKWRLVLRNEHEIVGHILGQPLYVEHKGTPERFILHKRQKGPLGDTLEDLVYVRRVVFGPQAFNQAVDELAGKAASPAAGQQP